jgi:uncharacterized protein YjlB
MRTFPIQLDCPDDGIFPNSRFPALLYKGGLDLPRFFPSSHIISLFESNGWSNAWKGGIFTYHHYHSVTHEVLGIYQGNTTLLLGGERGRRVELGKGDVLIIPAGVAHKNLGKEDQVKCVGAYPDGKLYDMNYGKPGERPGTDERIAWVPMPELDPLWGPESRMVDVWSEAGQVAASSSDPWLFSR